MVRKVDGHRADLTTYKLVVDKLEEVGIADYSRQVVHFDCRKICSGDVDPLVERR